MKWHYCLAVVLAFVLACAHIALTIDRVGIYGNQFRNERTGERFLIKGLAYQPTNPDGSYEDPITDDRQASWSKDLSYFQQLGINALRIYETDPTKPHDLFMDAAAAAGIYLLFDVPSQNIAVNRLQPTYTVELLEYYRSKVDAFAEFDNTMGFFVGNEVGNAAGRTTGASAYVKAAIRDLKRHVRSKYARSLPMGYAAVDDNQYREDEADFYSCGSDPDAKVDFYGLNVYSWCGKDATLQTSGFEDRVKEFAKFSIPLLLSEYGCNIIRPRAFTEVPAIYSAEMLDVFSGGIMYQYSEESNQYGIMTIDSKSQARKPMDEFTNFQSQLAKVKDVEIPKMAAKMSAVRVQCPAVDEHWHAAGNSLPPTPSKAQCDCVVRSLQCVLAPEQDPKTAGNLLATLCEPKVTIAYASIQQACESIGDGDPQTGKYGGFGGCSIETKVSLVLNAHREATGQCPTAMNGKQVQQQRFASPHTCSPSGALRLEPILATHLTAALTGIGVVAMLV